MWRILKYLAPRPAFGLLIPPPFAPANNLGVFVHLVMLLLKAFGSREKGKSELSAFPVIASDK